MSPTTDRPIPLDGLTSRDTQEALAEMLESQATLAGDDAAARAEALIELGGLYKSQLKDPEASLDAYSRAFQAQPHSKALVRLLEEGYRQNQNWEGLRSCLELAIASTPSPERKASLLCKLGEVFDEYFGEPQRASAVFEKALEYEPSHLEAIRGLQRVAVGDEDNPGAISAYTREVQICKEPHRSAFLFQEIATRCESSGDLAEAQRWWKRQLLADPDSISALEASARLSATQGDREGLCQTLEQLAPLVPAEEVGELRKRLAEAYAENDQIDAAIRTYRAALESLEEDLDTWGSMAELLARGQRHGEHAGALRHLISLEERPMRRRAHEKELAGLLSGPLNDPDAALEIFRRLAHEAPEPSVVEELEKLFEVTGRINEFIDWLTHLRNEAPRGSGEAAELSMHIAKLMGESANRWTDAAEIYIELHAAYPDEQNISNLLEEALRTAGDRAGLAAHLRDQVDRQSDAPQRNKQQLELASLLEELQEPSDELENLLGHLADEAVDPNVASEAAQRLRSLLEREKRWETLYQRLVSDLENTSVDNQRVEIHEQCALLCRHRRHNPKAAIPHLREALQLAPQRSDLWQQLAAVAQKAGDDRELLHALEGELATSADPKRQSMLHAQAAALCLDPVDEPLRAQTHLENLLRLEPTNIDAVDFFARAFEQAGQQDKLVALLQRYLKALANDSEQGRSQRSARADTLLLKLADLQREVAPDSSASISTLQRAMAVRGPSPTLTEPLLKYYQEEGRHEEVVVLCTNVLKTYDDPALSAEWNFQLAQSLKELGENEKAIAAYQETCALLTNDERALSALEQLYRCGESGGASLVRLLEARLEHTSGLEEIPLREELAECLSTSPLDRPQAALVHLQRILELDSNHPQALEKGIALARQMEEPQKELAFLEISQQRAGSPEDKIQVLLRKSELYADALERPDDSIVALRQALSIDPSRGEILTNLAQQLRQHGQWNALLTLLHGASKRARDKRRIAFIEEGIEVARTQVPDEVLPWLERLHKELPSDVDVLLQIASEHRAQDHSIALLNCLEKASVLCTEREQRIEICIEHATVLEQKLDSPAQALASLQKTNLEIPESEALLEEIRRLSEQLGLWRECAEALESLCTLSQGEDLKRVSLQAASVWADQLGTFSRAADHTWVALSLDSHSDGERLELLQQLGSQLRTARTTVAWVKVAEEELRSLDPAVDVFSERRLLLNAQLGQAYRLEFSDPERALPHFRNLVEAAAFIEEQAQSLDETPNYAGLQLEDAEAVFIGMLRSSGRCEELAERLEQRLERQPDAPDEWLELGQLMEEALHQPSRAAEAYRQVLNIWPDSKIALRGLRRVSERLGEWEELVKVLETERNLLADPSSEEAAGYWRRIGELCWSKLQSTTRASRAFAAALEASPGDLESLHSLQSLFEAMEDWRGAIDLYHSEIDILGDRAEDRSRELWLHIAAIAQEHTHELDRARRAFEAANKLAALSPEQNAELALIYEEEGDLQRFAELYTLFCDATSEAVCSDDHLRLGHALRKLELGEDALARYHSALDCESERGDESQLSLIWITIAEICSELNKTEEAAVAHAEAAQHQSPEDAAEELQRAALGIEGIDLDRASQWLQEAMECDPTSATSCAHRTRVCSALGDLEAAATIAVRAMELSDSHKRLDDELAVETASTGAMAAYRAEDPSTACLLYKQAVELDASRHDLQGLYAKVLFELGEVQTARTTLETLLTHSLADSQRGETLALLGSCLEQEDDCEQARERYLAAIDCDPRNQRATDGLLGIYERAGQVDEAMALLDRLGERADDAEHRGRILLQAAKIDLREGVEAQGVIEKLRQSIAATPSYPEAWTLLVDQLVESGTSEELATSAKEALEHVSDPQDRGLLAHHLGQGLEAMDHLPEASDAYSLAQQEDPTRVSDALKCAHLLRALGEWQGAADVLDRACETAAPSVPPSLRSQLFLHLARLLAGPLEDIGEATRAYRAALDCHPNLLEAQEGLALILVHQADAWKEAVKLNRAILWKNPSRVASLHAVMKVLRQRKKRIGEEDGAALLGALGVAPPSQRDRDEKPPVFSLRVSGKTELSDPLWETARKVLHTSKEEIAQALKVRNQGTESFENESDPQARFRVAALNAEGELTAPALVPLSNTEVMTVLRLVCQFALGSEQVEGDGSMVNAFAANLSRRAQRRVKRILGTYTVEDIESIDISLWRQELRDLANACALDSTEGDLWSALRVLVRDNHPDGDRCDLSGNIQELVQGAPAAQALQTRATHFWLDSISLR